MDRSTVSRIEEWDTRPTSDGYVGLSELADGGFTGAVAGGGAHLLMANGKIVGVANGTISAFEAGPLTAYEAPDPSLPLLFAMRDREGEVRGSYYTDDTPIREVDQTLSEGGFTGFLELSENVLSGDYFVVYYGGRSLPVAFVGNNGRVVTGDEAFQLAADEVGIYEVTDVELEVTDVPDAPESTEHSGGAAATASTVDAAAAEPESAGEPGDGTADEAETADAVDEDALAEASREDGGESVAIPDAEGEEQPAESEPASTEAAATESTASGREDPSSEGAVEEPADPTTGTAGGASSTTESTPTGSTGGTAVERPEDAPADEPDERFEEEARWRETRTVPALDPEESAEPASAAEPTQEPDPDPEPSTTTPANDAAVDTLRDRLDRIETQLQQSEQERERLTGRVETVVEERDELKAERERLEGRIEELEADLERARSSSAGGEDSQRAASGQAIDATTALDQTDLFVRYGSKSKPTLETAHSGQADADAVAENLRIDSHSRFDRATATVDGRPFEEFLTDTIQYRFVSWLVEVLLYEIRETGTEGKLRALYDVLPEIDRAEFNGTVASTDEEGETVSETFDVVCRNRMGKALIVANINDSLDPATGDMMATLVEDTTAVAEAHESIGAAFLVTASFFQPDALETAAEATRGGGFLSRDSKKSFVKLSRNDGYHLCLVEARGDDFHVAVPEF